MGHERAIGPVVIDDPATIVALRDKFRRGEREFSRGEFDTIAHNLTSEEVKKFDEAHPKPEYNPKMLVMKLGAYEGPMEKLGTIRKEAVEVVKALKPKHVIDLASGFSWVAKRIAKLRSRDGNKVTYTGVDGASGHETEANRVLDKLKGSGELEDAKFVVWDLNKGLPPEGLPEVNPGEKVVVMSIWGFGYLKADKQLELIQEMKAKGYYALVDVEVDPDKFNVDKILDAMLDRASRMSPKEQKKLASVIDSIKDGGPARKFMNMFGTWLKENAILRKPEEAEYYFKQSGCKVVRSKPFGPTTSNSNCFTIILN